MRFTAPASERPAGAGLAVASGDPAVLVAAAGRAEGSRAAAAALACAAADSDRAALLVDLGGRPPRQTLVATESARRLERRLAAHLPGTRLAARGQICWLAPPADPEGLAAAAAAAAVGRGALTAVHLPGSLARAAIEGDRGLSLTAALLCADLGEDRALVALAVGDLLARDLRVTVLKRPLGWVASRRALFGVLTAGSPGGLPPRALRGLGL